MVDTKSRGIWDASECVLLLIDYQDHVMELIFEQDRRVIELNVCLLAEMAQKMDVPVILSTVGVQMGANGPSIKALRDALPGVKEIDRSTMDAWEDPNIRAAVDATGRKRLVICGIATSACLAYPSVHALSEGWEVCFIEDAVGDSYLNMHQTAVLRLGLAGAVPNNTVGIIAEWFRDWKTPRAAPWRARAVTYYEELAALKRSPQTYRPTGLTPYSNEKKVAAHA